MAGDVWTVAREVDKAWSLGGSWSVARCSLGMSCFRTQRCFSQFFLKAKTKGDWLRAVPTKTLVFRLFKTCF